MQRPSICLVFLSPSTCFQLSCSTFRDSLRNRYLLRSENAQPKCVVPGLRLIKFMIYFTLAMKPRVLSESLIDDHVRRSKLYTAGLAAFILLYDFILYAPAVFILIGHRREMWLIHERIRMILEQGSRLRSPRSLGNE